jgi:RNB domain/Dis3-like cold-shock domain 2 (CSD2)
VSVQVACLTHKYPSGCFCPVLLGPLSRQSLNIFVTSSTGVTVREHQGASDSAMMSSSSRRDDPAEGERPWRQRHFVGGVLRSGGAPSAGTGNRDAAHGKFRVRERYWRTTTRRHARTRTTTTATTKTTTKTPRGDEAAVIAVSYPSRPEVHWILLLDAASWRTYLPLVHKVLLLLSAGDTTADPSSSSAITAPKQFEFVLLESIAELMDERNRSGMEDAASTAVDNGSAAARGVSERNALLRLVQRGQLRAFPDLSIREGDDHDDEWHWLSYEDMTTDDRGMHAMVRAGRMLLGSASSSSSALRVGLVVSDDEYARYLSQVPLDEGMCVLDVDGMLRLLVKDDDEAALTKLTGLAAECRSAYDRRRQNRNARRMADPTVLLEDRTHVELQGLTPEQIREGVRTGRLKRGRLEVSRDNPREAFVATRNGTYLVDPKGGTSTSTSSSSSSAVRAFHHDVVIVQELPQSQWGRPSQRIVPPRDDDDAVAASPEDVDDNNDNDATDPPIPTAAVVAIDQVSRRVFVATQLDPPKDSDSHALLVPMDVRIPKIRVPAKSYYAHQRLKVQVDAWDSDSNYPSGRCLEVIGPVGDLEAEVASLLIENQVNLEPFSTAALACLPSAGDNWTIPLDEVRRRNDLRTARLVFSVDPPGCQDIDDSMHAHVLPTGDVEVGVHIADVTHLVRHNSPLDLEAQARGTTFYLVDRRYDMLPSLLSSNLCSLHGQTDRLAVSVIWTLSPDLKHVKSTWFGRTVIHNRAGT